MAHAVALRTLDLDTGFFHTDMKKLTVHFHDQPTVLYCVPTNSDHAPSVPGPCADATAPVQPILDLLSTQPVYFPKFTNPDPSHNPEITNL